MARYRKDTKDIQADGAVVWCAKWMGGETIAVVENCRLVTLAGEMRANVYVTGEADTWFSIPAVCSIKGKRVTGYLTSEEGDLVFRHCCY